MVLEHFRPGLPFENYNLSGTPVKAGSDIKGAQSQILDGCTQLFTMLQGGPNHQFEDCYCQCLNWQSGLADKN